MKVNIEPLDMIRGYGLLYDMGVCVCGLPGKQFELKQRKGESESKGK